MSFNLSFIKTIFYSVLLSGFFLTLKEITVSPKMIEQIKEAQRYLAFLRHENVDPHFSESEIKKFRKQFDDSTKINEFFKPS